MLLYQFKMIGKRGSKLFFIFILQASAFKFCPVSPCEGAGQGFASTPLQNIVSTDCKVPDGKTNSGQSLHRGNNGHETQADSSVNVGVAQLLPKVAPCEFSSQERNYALTRYKEKKKCRRYNLFFFPK